MGCSQGKPAAPTALPRDDQTQLGDPSQTLLVAPKDKEQAKGIAEAPVTREVSSPRELNKVLSEQKLRKQESEENIEQTPVTREISSPRELNKVLSDQKLRQEESEANNQHRTMSSGLSSAGSGVFASGDFTPGNVTEVGMPDELPDQSAAVPALGSTARNTTDDAAEDLAASTPTFGSQEVLNTQKGQEAIEGAAPHKPASEPTPTQQHLSGRQRQDSSESNKSGTARKQKEGVCC